MGAGDLGSGGSGSTPPQTGARPAAPRGLRSFPGGFVVGVVIAVAVTLLIIQNGESTQLDWLAFHFQAPLWIMLLLTLAAGGVIAEAGKVAVGRWLAGAKKRRMTARPEPAPKGRKA